MNSTSPLSIAWEERKKDRPQSSSSRVRALSPLPPSPNFLRSPQFSRGQKSKNRRETFATQARFEFRVRVCKRHKAFVQRFCAMNLSHVHPARYTIRHGRGGVRVSPYSVSNLSIQNRHRGYISTMCVDGEKSIGIRAQGVRNVVAFVVDSGNLENEGAWVGDGTRKYRIRPKQPRCFVSTVEVTLTSLNKRMKYSM